MPMKKIRKTRIASSVGRFPLLAGPLLQDSTVVNIQLNNISSPNHAQIVDLFSDTDVGNLKGNPIFQYPFCF